MIEAADVMDEAYIGLIKMADVQHDLLQQVRVLKEKGKQDARQLQSQQVRMVDAQRAAENNNEARLRAEVKLGKVLVLLQKRMDEGEFKDFMEDVSGRVKKDQRIVALSEAYDSQPVEGSGESDSEVLERGESTLPGGGHSA